MEQQSLYGFSKLPIVIRHYKCRIAGYTSYKLAFAEDAIDAGSWTGQDGNWLTADREGLLPRWDKACEYNVKNGTKDKYAPINQIHDLYIWIQKKVKLQGHKVKWVDGALSLVSKLKNVDNSAFFNGFIVDDTQQILSELNLGIANYAIGKFSTLLYTYSYGTSNPVLSKKDAYEWDKSFIEYEQGVVAPPIYNKWLGTKGLQNMQAAADRGFFNFSGPLPYYSSSSALISGAIFGNAAPRFVDFGALVTDTQFRIDLPILMLYLDTHKPKAGGKFTNLKPDGTISDAQKALIKPFEIK